VFGGSVEAAEGVTAIGIAAVGSQRGSLFRETVQIGYAEYIAITAMPSTKSSPRKELRSRCRGPRRATVSGSG
jgi:hypothetical protein